jgi:N utilization substance protein B
MADAQVRARRRGRLVAAAAQAEAPVGRTARTGATRAVAPDGGDAEAQAFAERLVAGAIAHREVIDPLLESLAPAWGVGRMAAVDRAILRLGAYELMYEDTPEAVAASEAVELARQYSTAESPRFVNGVLGALAPRPRPDGVAAAAPPAAPRRGTGAGGAPA